MFISHSLYKKNSSQFSWCCISQSSETANIKHARTHARTRTHTHTQTESQIPLITLPTHRLHGTADVCNEVSWGEVRWGEIFKGSFISHIRPNMVRPSLIWPHFIRVRSHWSQTRQTGWSVRREATQITWLRPMTAHSVQLQTVQVRRWGH